VGILVYPTVVESPYSSIRIWLVLPSTGIAAAACEEKASRKAIAMPLDEVTLLRVVEIIR